MTAFVAFKEIIALLLGSAPPPPDISQTARFENPQSTVPVSAINSPLRPINGSTLAVFGNSLAGGVVAKTSAISVSPPLGSSAFNGAFSIACTVGAVRLVTGVVISGASSAGIAGTGSCEAAASSTALFLG